MQIDFGVGLDLMPPTTTMPSTARVGITDPMTLIDKARLDFFLKLFIALAGLLVGPTTTMV